MHDRLQEQARLSTTPHFATWPAEGRPSGWFTPSSLAGAAPYFQDKGFLVLEDALTPDEVDAINAEALRLCRNEGGTIDGLAPAGAVGDQEALRRVLCIHFPHKMSKLMHGVLSQPRIVDVLTRVVGPNVKCMQSMLFIKASGKPGQAWHQDEDYIPTRDRSLIGAWIALDDATLENGCLWIIPGSHKSGILWKQEWHGDRRFDCALEARGFPYTEKDEVPVEVKKGSVVFFNGYTLHRSLPNRSQGAFRRSLVNHYMSAESFLPWKRPDDKTSMAMADYRDVVLVAGVDPYAYKGTTDQAKPVLRAAGEGGCVDWITQEKLAYSS
jgi:ectoine hydroxylase-related dioxygenase (phytanoyl-CoA dioxygenase family)